MLFRKIAVFSAALIVFGCASQARAQVGLYATIAGERIGGITCQAVPVTTPNQCTETDGAVRPYGVNFGGYYEFRSVGRFQLGGDLRGGVVNTNKPANTFGSSTDFVRHYSALGGVRGSMDLPFHHLRPYASIDAGYARTDAVTAPNYQNFTQVQAYVGLDVPLFSGIEIRAIELGAGELFGPSTHSTQSIGAGLALRFGR